MQCLQKTKLVFLFLLLQDICQSSKEETRNYGPEHFEDFPKTRLISEARNLNQNKVEPRSGIDTLLQLLLKFAAKFPTFFKDLVKFLIQHPLKLPDVFHGLFLQQVDCNIIFADWANGAKPPNYAKVAANSPMAGAIISLLVQKIINATSCELRPENVTIVGSSLGAQTAGFAGRHFYRTTRMKLGRITGLDPANLLFKGTNVSLSREDAEFVDVIQTNQGNIEAFQWGMDRSIGHVDFYPNGGRLQEGCKPYPDITKINFTAMKSPADLFVALLVSSACSHARAPNLFIESITNHTCNFTSVPCPGGWDNYENCSREFKTNESLVGLMGYYSFTRQGRGDQYLRTRNSTPFCIPDSYVEEGTTASQ